VIKTASIECDKCKAGTFSNDSSQFICSLCSIGTYQPDDGKTICLDCPKGFDTE